MEHLEKMYRFWQTILLEEHLLRKPFPPHKQLPIAKEHFDWMEIFTSTTDELFGATAEEAKLRARIWQKCSITKLTILEMLDKMAIF
jgi:hemoglobin